MQHVVQLASRYRIVLDRAEDQTFVATCQELPGPSARSLSVDAVVSMLRRALVARVRALLATGDSPTPLRDSEGPIGAWMTDLELISELVMATPADRVERPNPSALHAIAKWTIDRYRIILEGDEEQGFVAASPEMPEIFGVAPTASRAASELRWRLEDRAFAILSANRLPPEPLQDVEAQQSQQSKWQTPAPSAIALAA
jgi:predicted RNase H-like HicB family nuclease